MSRLQYCNLFVAHFCTGIDCSTIIQNISSQCLLGVENTDNDQAVKGLELVCLLHIFALVSRLQYCNLFVAHFCTGIDCSTIIKTYHPKIDLPRQGGTCTGTLMFIKPSRTDVYLVSRLQYCNLFVTHFCTGIPTLLFKTHPKRN